MESIFSKRILIFLILILLGGASVINSVNSMNEDKIESNILKSTTWIVDDDNIDGPWDGTQENPYRYIQDAVNAANSSDIIHVYSGNYSKFKVYNKDMLTIIGKNTDNYRPRVDGDGMTNVIEVDESNYVNITGFEIFNSGVSANDAGIYYYNSHYGTILDNIIRNNVFGVYARDSDHMHISYNICFDNTKSGIYLESNHGTISHNECYNNTKDGILISKARNNKIYNNNFIDNKHFGVFVVEETLSISQFFNKNKIFNNNIMNNEEGYAVQIKSINTWEYNWWGAILKIKIIMRNYQLQYWCLPPIIDLYPLSEEAPVQ